MQTSGDANLAQMAAMAAAAPAATASIRPAPALRFPAIAIGISLFAFSLTFLYKASETWVSKTPTAFEEPGFWILKTWKVWRISYFDSWVSLGGYNYIMSSRRRLIALSTKAALSGRHVTLLGFANCSALEDNSRCCPLGVSSAPLQFLNVLVSTDT